MASAAKRPAGLAVKRDAAQRKERASYGAKREKAFAKTVAGMLNWTSRWFVPGGILDADEVAYGMADTILAGVLVKEPLSEATPQ